MPHHQSFQHLLVLFFFLALFCFLLFSNAFVSFIAVPGAGAGFPLCASLAFIYSANTRRLLHAERNEEAVEAKDLPPLGYYWYVCFCVSE